MDREQISLFEIIQNEIVKELEPMLNLGQQVFVLCLDKIEEYTVETMWVAEKGSETPYFRYSARAKNNVCTSVGDIDLNKTVFVCREEAEKKAQQVESQIVKISPHEMSVCEPRSFAYYRKCDNYRLTADIAKVGELQLYEHKFMCYHFLYTYPNKKGRDKDYEKLLSDMLKETARNNGRELENSNFETLYFVKDGEYASASYAVRHNYDYKELG